MSSGLEPILNTNHSNTDWITASGNWAIIHAAVSAPAAESLANETLSEVEKFVEGLHRLLSPPEDRAGRLLEIYLYRSPQSEFNGTGTSEPNNQTEQRSNGEACTIELRLPTEGTHDPVFVPVTRCLILQWFGEDAASTVLFVEGIAGYVAAQAAIGPSTEEADQWVQSELEAKKPIKIASYNSHGKPIRDAAGFEGIDPAATSFMSFLVNHSGAGALRNYLTEFDPARLDHGANEAYHQPLAVLEEEWLARVKRRSTEKDAFRTFLRHVWPLLKPYRWKQLEILIYLLLAAGYNVVQPYAIKTVIDRLNAQVSFSTGTERAAEVFLHTLAPFVLLLFGIYVLNGLVSLRRAYTVSWLNQNILNTLQIRMFAHLQRLAHNYYVNSRVGDIMARLNNDLDNVQSALSQVTNKALYQSFTVAGALTALFLLTSKSPEMAVPILCILPLFAANYMALRTRNKQASREQRRRVGQAMANVQENLNAHAVIKAFTMESRTISEYRSRILSLQKSKLRLALLSALTDLSEDMATALAQLIIFGVGGYLVIRDHGQGLGVGDLSALLVLVKSIFSPVASLAGIGQTMQQATGAIERVGELFQEPILVADKPGALALPPLSKDIRLEKVTFAYGGSKPAIRDLTLSIPAGKHVAVVGPSGSGKSSLVNLILRFWDPEEGRVLFDGQDARDASLESLRGQIGLVFQETFIFNTTLRTNIAIGRPDATDSEIEEAAKAAQLMGYINSLPAGLDTVPGENGARMSTGQKQRIAIARAFLRNPRILVLDEATSALDAKTEAGILQTLAELARGRTTISVTHRIVQAAAADHIFVLDSGRLVEEGTHEDLVRRGGLYQKLYERASGVVNGNSREPVAVEAS